MSPHPHPRRRRLAFAAFVCVVAGVLMAMVITGEAGVTATPAPASTRAAGPLPLAAEQQPAPPRGCRYRPRTTSVRSGPAGRRRVALTFDDGPTSYTSRILDLLEGERVPATFFVVGRKVAGREDLLLRMLRDGHMIANHSYTHVDLSKASAAALRQIDDTQDAIKAATGFTPCLLRPPYGRTSRKLLGALARRHLTGTLWSVNPRDFLRPGTAAISQRVLDGVRPGSIILAHDGGGDRSQTVAALPSIIATLKARGYTFVTVTELLGLRVTR